MLDVRNLSCPTPVLTVKKEILKNSPKKLEILLNDTAAMENIMRFSEFSGYSVLIQPLNQEETRMTLKKE